MSQSQSTFRDLTDSPLDPDLTRNMPRVAEQHSFVSAGYVHLEDLWTAEFSRELADEAFRAYPFAEIPIKGPRTVIGESRESRGGSRYATNTRAATGPLLTGLHMSLVDYVQALTGRLLVPTFSAYGYYESNDRCLLHLDKEDCDLTLLTTALGAVGPLHLHPTLRGVTIKEISALESDPDWDRTGGITVVYPRRGLTAMTGNVLPHHRPGKPIPELAAVAALCYRSLF